ncbi:MAG: histidine kinase [Bacteroidetes bacterium]|nr:histidine kinase [Bacteroidota bacterium]MBL7104447.1 histidine kinase [Bacteroidales bacterium]
MIYLLVTLLLIIVFSFSLYYLEDARSNNGPPGNENFQHPPSQSLRQENIGTPDGAPPPPPQRKNPFPFPPFVNMFIISVLIIGFDTGMRMMVRWSKLEQEKTLLEKENVQNQLAFLRNQVSPHFFMNTLNNIHALIDVNTEEAKESVIKLSKLMRHLLYDSQSELVSLSKEFEFIKSYINLMKLRYSEKVKIKLSVPEQLPDKSIPPLLFTSFVENAFKHGISYQNSSFINITFSLEPEHLTFEIVNSIPDIKKDKSEPGIGIENSRKRLDIIYRDKYSLNIEEKSEEYKLILTIPV